jgi:lipoate-protein ligase B
MDIAIDKKVSRHDTLGRVYIARYLGIVPYELALKKQEELMQLRYEGNIPDTLILLQHPSVFTIGRFKGREELIAPLETLAQETISLLTTSRGGGITYHGPGQLIGYPVINLKENRLGVRQYIQKLETVIIKVLLELGIQGRRIAQYPGVWVNEKKICSVGVKVSHHITMHGFALNVDTDLRHFKYINPCGMNSKVMTSLAKLLGHSIEIETIIEPLLDSFSAVFGLELKQGDSKCMAILDALNG